MGLPHRTLVSRLRRAAFRLPVPSGVTPTVVSQIWFKQDGGWVVLFAGALLPPEFFSGMCRDIKGAANRDQALEKRSGSGVVDPPVRNRQSGSDEPENVAPSCERFRIRSASCRHEGNDGLAEAHLGTGVSEPRNGGRCWS